MRWSIEELIEALRIHKSFGFFRWLWELPARVWKRLKVFFKWVFTGYTDLSIWDLRMFLLETIIYRLGKFKDNVDISYPYEFEDHQGWVNALNEMYEAFVIMKDETIIQNASNKITFPGLGENEIGTFFQPLSEEHSKIMNEAYEKQRDNDEKALNMLVRHFHDLWD